VLLIALAVAEAFVGASAAESELVAKLEQVVGPSDAAYILNLLQSSRGKYAGRAFPIVGVITAFLAAMVVFSELQSSLNSVWNIRSKSGLGILRFIYSRIVSFILVVGIGVLLLVSVATSTVLSTIEAFFTQQLMVPPNLLVHLNSVISFAMIPLLLALAYKLIPAVHVSWRNVWAGCIVASLLLLVGKSAVGMYLSMTSMRSVYGAAGSLVISLMWVYYSAQVFFFGAELTKVYARRYGSRISGDSPT
jgi:membrane protein